jgi:hypothetical protein
MKKLILLTTSIIVILSLCGCNTNDCIEVWNRSPTIFDDIQIQIKPDYFYDRHEKFTVDDDTVGVTVYFSTDNDDWELN